MWAGRHEADPPPSRKVLSEVRNAPTTLKRSAPVAVLTVTVLYILANVAYFSALTKSEIANSNVTVAADFFRNVYGASGFIDTGVPVLIALSALGNVFAQTFAFSRVKQEFGKQGLFPFSRLWASDWPCQAPTGGIFLHWLFTCIVIVGPSVKDAYPFVSTLHVYTQSWVKLFIGIGLLYLTYSKHENWRPRRTELHAWPVTTVFWIISLAFVIVAPFLPNTTVSPSIPWFVVPTVGTSVFLLGGLYWLGWAKIWPMFGYAIHHDIQELPDGSEVVRFVVGGLFIPSSISSFLVPSTMPYILIRALISTSTAKRLYSKKHARARARARRSNA
ncbi:MAG: hypothetical protein M1815_001596 [Lichina confinis]|nr:MAG: hypothetical protein M1815_001596 [Lichina confinis]